jgi:hypothetical protein
MNGFYYGIMVAEEKQEAVFSSWKKGWSLR